MILIKGEVQQAIEVEPHSWATVEEKNEPLLNHLVPRILPHLITSEVIDHSTSYQVHVPFFHFNYDEPLLGLRGIPTYYNHLMLMKTFEIFVDIHWNIKDDYVYWRSVVIWCGHIVERLIVYRRQTAEFSPVKMFADTP